VPDPGARFRLDLSRPAQRGSREPIAQGCGCPACAEHTRGYLHYLVRAGELTAKRLITLHNLTFMAELMQGIREGISTGSLDDYEARVLDGREPYGLASASDRAGSP
jgi:queuine tRNA-ribosyltransferase